MSTDEDFQRIALSLPGTEAWPHVDGSASCVCRAHAARAPDRLAANLMCGPRGQEAILPGSPPSCRCLTNGGKGATLVVLAAVTEGELRKGLRRAWESNQ